MPTQRRPRPRLLALLAVVLLAGLPGALTSAAPASAHAALRSSSPAAGDVVEHAPREVVLRLSEAPLTVGAVVRVTSASGSVVSTGGALVAAEEVRQAVRATQAGSYRVDWRVTSSDGHPLSGSFTFTVRTASDPAGAASVAPPTARPAPTATQAEAASHHGADVHAGDEVAFRHVAGTVVILLLGALGCALSLRRSSTTSGPMRPSP